MTLCRPTARGGRRGAYSTPNSLSGSVGAGLRWTCAEGIAAGAARTGGDGGGGGDTVGGRAAGGLGRRRMRDAGCRGVGRRECFAGRLPGARITRAALAA